MDELEQEFKDYFEEMSQIISFDAEVCPTCGIDFTGKNEIQKVQWTKVFSTNDMNVLQQIVEKFESAEIKYFLQKDEKSTTINLLVTSTNRKAANKLVENPPEISG